MSKSNKPAINRVPDRDFCKQVGERCKSYYCVDDGSGMCFNMIEQGEIDMTAGVNAAAQQVAMQLTQE